VAVHERGMPPGPGHHHVFDWSRVLSCPSCGYGDLRHFSHDDWPSEEDVDMEWSTQLQPDALTVLKAGVAACPDPTLPACECAVHVSLRESEKGIRRKRIYPRGEDGERPDVFVALGDDGAPEFMHTADR
jgi:hypothetical protein